MGLILFVAALTLYVLQNCLAKEVIEFESFEMSNPTPISVVPESKMKQLSTFST